MSSALQCLFHTEELVEYFFSQNYKNDLFNYNKNNYLFDHSKINSNIDQNNLNKTNNIIKSPSDILVNDSLEVLCNIPETLGNNKNFLKGVQSSELESQSNKNFEKMNRVKNEELSNSDIIKNNYEIENLNINHFNINNNYDDIYKNLYSRNGINNNEDLNDSNKNYKECYLENSKNKHYDPKTCLSSSGENEVIILDCEKDNNRELMIIKEKSLNENLEKNSTLINNEKMELEINIDDKESKLQSRNKIINNPNKNFIHENSFEEYDIYIDNINKINPSTQKTREEKNRSLESECINYLKQNNKISPSNLTLADKSKKYPLTENHVENSYNYLLHESPNKKILDMQKKYGNTSSKDMSYVPILFADDEEKEKQLILFTQNFKDLINKMWSKGSDLINPKEFRESLICLNSQFNNYSQQDAHELLTFILESLHLKLNRGHLNSNFQFNFNCNEPNFHEDSCNLNLNKTQSILNWENHLFFNDSVINDLFYGLLLSSLTCKKCQTTNVTYEPFNHLGLSIPNEFHLFIYVIPYFIKTNSTFEENQAFKKDCENEYFSQNYNTIKNTNEDIEMENTIKENLGNNDNLGFQRSIRKKFPKAIKMYLKINDNMQFKNIIDSVAERLNYDLKNAVFYSVLDNQIIRVIESDERCGELMQRDYFLFINQTGTEEELLGKYLQIKELSKFKIEKQTLDFTNYDYIEEKLNFEEKINNIAYKNKLNDNDYDFFHEENPVKFYLNYHFCSFPKGKFDGKLISNAISYPRILSFFIDDDFNFLIFILQELIENIKFIFDKNYDNENLNDLNGCNSRKISICLPNDFGEKANKKRNLDKNNKSKKIIDLNKSDKKYRKNSYNFTQENTDNFIYEISKLKNFIFCNKAVLLDENNSFFTYENTQEKFDINSKIIHNSINKNINDNNINKNSITYPIETSNSKIKVSLLKKNNLKSDSNSSNDKNINNENSFQNNKISNKYICLFCSSIDNNFFNCDCINEFISSNQHFFEVGNSLMFENANNIKKKIKDNNHVIEKIMKFDNINFCKIQKNFLQNFQNYSKENICKKPITRDLLTQINIFCSEEIIQENFRELNACKDFTSYPQKESLITLYDLLNYFTAEEKLREEKYFCENCNALISRIKKLEINKFPKILIINFKRFRYDFIQSKSRNTRRGNEFNLNNNNLSSSNNHLNFGGEKNENKIDFPFDLDLTKFNRYEESTIYELYAVCNHEGKITGGHYKAICKDFQSNKWFEFDDKIVKQINEDTIVSHKAYILFYRKKKD